MPYQGPLVGTLEELGVKVRVFPLAVMRRKYFGFFGMISFVLTIVMAYFRLTWLCWRERVTLIHSNTSAVIIGGFVSKTMGIPHLWHLREIHVKPLIIRKWVCWLYKNFATKVIGVSQATIDNLKIDSPEIEEKSIVINNGIEIDLYLKKQSEERDIRAELGLSNSDVLVGMIARVSHWKGQDLFLKVASEVFEEADDIHFLALGSPFMGNENLMDQFRTDASGLKRPDHFHIHEFDENVRQYLEAFDIFILPSTLPDPFPTTVLEAMVTRKAIIVNGHGGAVEMIEDQRSGIIIHPPNDSTQMAQQVLELSGNKSQREILRQNAYDRAVEKYNESVYKKNITKVFTEYLR